MAGRGASFRVGGESGRWSMEVDIPLSTLPLQFEQAFVGCPLSFVRESLVSLGRRLTRQKEPWVNGREGILKVEGGAERFRGSTGGGGGFRVARRARSWPAARGAVGFRGRGHRPLGGSGPGASRGHETARRAVHESPRARDAKAAEPLVETRKSFAPRSNSQLVVEKDAWPRISWIRTDFERMGGEKEFRIEFSFCRR